MASRSPDATRALPPRPARAATLLAAAGVLLVAGGGRANPEDYLPYPKLPVLHPSLRSLELLPVVPADGGEPFLLFLADDPDGGTGFWRTDGTPGGTLPVARPWPDGGAPLGEPVAFDGAVWVLASAPGGEVGLYRSDGTAAGTGLAVPMGIRMPFFGHGLVPCGGRLFFAGVPAGATDAVLFASDGTSAGTGMVRADGQPRVVWGNLDYQRAVSGTTLYFLGTTPGEGEELWKSDGTEAGTVLVKDIRPGPSGSLQPWYWSTGTAGGLFFFPADDGTTGLELWRTDGTPEGTGLVADLFPGPEGSDPYCLGEVGGRLVFGAKGGSRGRDVWATDGTGEGTVLLHDFPEPPEFYPSGVLGLGMLGGLLYFVATDPQDGTALWRTYGTPGGTALVATLTPDLFYGAGTFQDLPGTGVSVFDARNYNGDVAYAFCTDGTASGTMPCNQLYVRRVWKGGLLVGAGDLFGAYGPLYRFSYGQAGLSESDADDDGDGFSTELEDAVGSAWWDAASTPLGPPPAPATLPLAARRVSLHVSARIDDTDSLLLEGSLPVPAGFEPEGRTVTVDAGGLIRTFTLDARGRARGEGKEEFRLTFRRRKGVVREDLDTPFRLRLSEGRFMVPLLDERLDAYDLGGERTLPVTVLWEGRAYRSPLPLASSADRRHRGRAVLVK